MEKIAAVLKRQYPNLVFRHRQKIPKKEIHSRLASFDERLGKVLFVREAAIKPDGGVLEVLDHSGRYRVILVSESKHQGNDVQKIRAGIKQGKRKDQDIMNAGNAIERVGHPTQKPRALIQRLVRSLSYPGSTVVDFFGGSGITTRVAIEEGRHSVCCDTDDAFRHYVSAQVKKIGDPALTSPIPQFEINENLSMSHPVFGPPV